MFSRAAINQSMTNTQTILFSLMFGLFTALASLVAVSISNPAHSTMSVSMTPVINKPLVVLRFNQRKIYFEQPLYSAVSKAVQVKPNVRFSLVSYVPNVGDLEKDQKLMAKANKNVRSVTDAMVKMGVPLQRLHVKTQLDPRLKYDEVHIFVQ